MCMLYLYILVVCLVVHGIDARRRNRPALRGYGNETIVESEREGDNHVVRIVLPSNVFIDSTEESDETESESHYRPQLPTQDTRTGVHSLVQGADPLPPTNIHAYRMSGPDELWTQAQVRWTPNGNCSTGYRIRYISELTSERGGLEAISDTVYVGPVDWVDLSAAGRMVVISIATECRTRFGPFSPAHELEGRIDHPDRVEILDIRTQSPTVLEVSLTCKLIGHAPGVRFLVMARRVHRKWSPKRNRPAKTWSFPGTGGPVFNLTGLRPGITYWIEVRLETFTPHGDRIGPWSETIEITTLADQYDDLIMVQNPNAEVSMYGPPLNITHSYLGGNRVSLYWRPPHGTGICMALPGAYRVTYGALNDGNFMPERVRDVEVTMRLIPRGIFRLKHIRRFPYLFQITALNRDGISSLWVSNLHRVPVASY